ncbi:MAG: hypothetical protein HUN04_14060 [Desulfobacter sp.]|nr:MAG: hypothetical protein HUN04_14060 [Desulfobacter sp.]
MGAIFGYSQLLFPGKNQVNNMAGTLDFRGNHVSTHLDDDFVLGVTFHSREADTKLVVDEERSIIAACEGEIYNTDQLYNSLKDKELIPKPKSGFDLIPLLYAEKGYKFPRNINGSFTIALWDGKSKTLLLIRDHLGSHSLFYTLKKDLICFSTRIKSILETGCVEARLDYGSLTQYLASLALSPPKTMFKNIFAVRPGHMTILNKGNISEYAYWPIHEVSEDRDGSREYFSEKLKELFIDAVSIRIRKGEKTGALVSGGVDTSAIVSVLSRHSLADNLKGFSIAFEEREYSDASLQHYIYKDYDLEPCEIILNPVDFSRALLEGVIHLDSPVNDVAYAGMYVAMENVSKAGCSVVFEGEGSDEIFCTGHSMGELSVQKFISFPFVLRQLLFGWAVHHFPDGSTIPDKVIRLLGRIGMSDLERRSTWIPGFTPKQRRLLLGDREYGTPFETAEEYYGRTRLNDFINIYQYGLTKLFLPDDLLFKNERMAAAQGIINRTPFIDYRLVEQAFRVPGKFKLARPSAKSDGTKLIFKKAIQGMIPDEILHRKKSRGFSQPSGIWFKGPLRSFVTDHLFSSDTKVTDHLDPSAVRRIYERQLKGELSGDYFLNSLLILELWMRQYL